MTTIFPPEYRIIQGTTLQRRPELAGKPGQFYHTLRGDVCDSITAIILRILPTRTLWSKDEISESPPECSAIGDITKSIDGADCLKCNKRCDDPWDWEAGERRNLCCPGWLVLGIDRDNGDEPFIIRAKGASASPLRAFGTVMRAPRYRKGFGIQIKFTTVKKTNPLGIFHVLQLTGYRPVKEEEIEEIADYLAELRGADIGMELSASEETLALPKGKGSPPPTTYYPTEEPLPQEEAPFEITF